MEFSYLYDTLYCTLITGHLLILFQYGKALFSVCKHNPFLIITVSNKTRQSIWQVSFSKNKMCLIHGHTLLYLCVCNTRKTIKQKTWIQDVVVLVVLSYRLIYTNKLLSPQKILNLLHRIRHLYVNTQKTPCSVLNTKPVTIFGLVIKHSFMNKKKKLWNCCRQFSFPCLTRN